METVFPPFRVSLAAVAQIEAVGGTVRIDVGPGGCCGTAYEVSAGPAAGADARFGCPGAELFVSAAALPLLTGARLDYSGRIKPPRFRVLGNPNTPDRCPCNRSFGRAWPGRGQPDCRAAVPMPWDA
jgi:iron-sulfur cluster assembly accessory protein